MSSIEECQFCDSSSPLTIEARSYEKDPITVYGLQVLTMKTVDNGNRFFLYLFICCVEALRIVYDFVDDGK